MQIRLSADSVLSNIVTQQVFDSVFRYNCSKSSTIINNTYWADCEVRTTKQNNLFKKQNLKTKEKYFEIVYDCYVLDTLEGLVKIFLDKKGKQIRIIGINPNDKYNLLSKLSISKQSAIDIAIKTGFKQGLTDWTTTMTYQKLTVNQNKEKYYWKIKNTLKLGDSNGCNSEGELIYIDATSGEISEKNNWTTECINK
jgi:Zn-dependent metalloprotease